MGRSDGPTVYTRHMVGFREIESYQLLRTKDCFNCSAELEKSAEKPHSLTTAGHHDSCSISDKRGGHTVQIPALSGKRDSDVSRSAEHIGTTKLPAWSNEHGGRCLVMVEEGQGMDAGPGSSTKHIHDIRSAGGRPICIRERQTADTLLLHGQTRPPLPGDGRSTPQLGASRTNRFSKSLLFRRFIALKVHCSKKRFIVPKVYWSEGIRNRGSLLRRGVSRKPPRLNLKNSFCLFI